MRKFSLFTSVLSSVSYLKRLTGFSKVRAYKLCLNQVNKRVFSIEKEQKESQLQLSFSGEWFVCKEGFLVLHLLV